MDKTQDKGQIFSKQPQICEVEVLLPRCRRGVFLKIEIDIIHSEGNFETRRGDF